GLRRGRWWRRGRSGPRTRGDFPGCGLIGPLSTWRLLTDSGRFEPPSWQPGRLQETRWLSVPPSRVVWPSRLVASIRARVVPSRPAPLYKPAHDFLTSSFPDYCDG